MNEYQHLRNPWHGIDTWKEFKYDMRHPIRFCLGALHNVNGVGRGQRRAGLGLMIVGCLNIAVGIAMVVRGILG